MNISEQKMDKTSITFLVLIILGLIGMMVALFKTMGSI